MFDIWGPFTDAAMLRAFFSLYCLVKNTLPPKVFFKFFKEQILFFFGKFAGTLMKIYLEMQNFLWILGYVNEFSINI